MDSVDYLFILTAYFIASLIKGLTGIGFSTSCLPVMALHLDLKVAIPLVIVPSVVSNMIIMIQAGSFGKAIRRFWPMYLSSIPGLLIGLTFLIAINVNIAKIILGLVLVLYSLLTMLNTPYILPQKWERKLKIPVGFLTGFINGLTGSQVIPVLPYLMALDLSKNSFVQAINISFTLSSLIMLLSMNQLGYLSPNIFLTAIVSLPAVLAIVYFSGRIRNHLPKILYRKLVLIFLLMMGLIITVKSMF